MDEYSNRRTVDGHPDSGRVSDLVSKRTPRTMSQTAQLGCSNRSNVAKSSKIACSEILNASKRPFRYAECKRVVGGSSSINSSSKCLWEPQRKLTPKVEKVLPESASSSGSSNGSIDHVSEVTGDILLLHHDAGCTSTEHFVRSTLSSQSSRTGNNFTGKPGLTDLAGSGYLSKSKISQTTIPRLSHSSSKHFSKSSKCNSSSVESRVHKRMELLKKGSFEGESSSSGVKKTSTLKIGEASGSARGKSTAKLRKELYWSGWDNGAASVTTQRSAVLIGGAKPPNLEYGNNSALNESNSIIQGKDTNGHEVSVSISASSMLDTNTSDSSINHPIAIGNSTRSLDSSVSTGSANQGGFPDMDSINEVLLALERTGHVEQLSYERLLFLEMNSFLSGLSFHDQHRDMRLDIDHMSYEDLLALEDRIGCVSTALTGEAMDRCLDKSFYMPTPTENTSIGFNKDEDDLKCSICQEKYEVGDEVGRLHCEHLYHLCCIQQWLNLKNWCPICKGSAVPS